MAVRDGEDDRRRVPVDQRLPVLRRRKQLVAQPARLRRLHGEVVLERPRRHGRVQQLAPDAPVLAVGLDEDAGHVPVDLAHGDEPGPGRVLVGPLLQQVDGDFRVGDDDGGAAAEPQRVDGPVPFRPLLELDPRVRLGDVEFVADKGEWARAGGHAVDEDEVGDEDVEQGGEDGEGDEVPRGEGVKERHLA